MAESLDSTEVIGGVSVVIQVDKSQLSAAPAQVKEIAKQIEGTPAKLRIVADSSAMKAVVGEVGQVAKAVQQAAATASATVIKPRFDFQEQAVRDRMAALIASMRNQAQTANIEIQARARLFGESKVANDPVQALERQIARPAASQILREQIQLLKNANGGIGSGSGDSDGVGGGDGGGRSWASRNLLSARGLGALTGSLTAVIGALEGLKVVAAYERAGSIMSGYRNILEERGAVGSYQAINDPNSNRAAKQMAFAQADMEKQQAWNSLPVVGAIATLIDSVKGTTVRDQNYVEIFQKQIEANEKAATSATAERSQITRITSGKEYQAVADENVEILQQKGHEFFVNPGKQTFSDLQQAITLAILRDRQALANDNSSADAALNQGANGALEGGSLGYLASGNNRDALLYRQQIQANDLVNKQKAEAAKNINLSGPDQGMMFLRQSQDTANQKKQDTLELIQFDKQAQALLTSIESEGAAERVRIAQGELAAKTLTLQQSVAAQITAATATQKFAAVISGASKLFADFMDRRRAVQDDVRNTTASVKSSQFRLNHDDQLAAVSDFENETANQLEAAKVKYGENSQQYKDVGLRRNASESVLKDSQQRVNDDQTAAIDAHVAANNLRAQPGHEQQADILEQDAAGIAQIKDASPEMRAKVAEGILSDFSTRRHELTTVQAAGETVNAQGGQIIAIPQEARRRLAAQNDAVAQINKDMQAAKAASVLPPNKTLPGSTDGLGAGQASQLLNDIKSLLGQILSVASAGSLFG